MQVNQPLKKGIVVIATFALGTGTAPRLSAQEHQASEPHGWLGNTNVKTRFRRFRVQEWLPVGDTTRNAFSST